MNGHPSTLTGLEEGIHKPVRHLEPWSASLNFHELSSCSSDVFLDKVCML